LPSKNGSQPFPLKGVFLMLVLSRKQNERLVIDGNIIVTVVRVAGGQVRLGIEAPADVHIRREELLGGMDPRNDGRFGTSQQTRAAG
jgi:carbon storage regulator